MDDCSAAVVAAPAPVTEITGPEPDDLADVVDMLKKQLAEKDDKLLKFKNFVVTLRDERNKLKERVNEDQMVIEKLKAQVQKSHNSGQLFQNLQNLQQEYDKSQDEVEEYKRTNKELRADLSKCMEELNRNREISAERQEEIRMLKANRTQQESQIAAQKATISDLESKIIVLEAQINEEQTKVNNYETNVSELNQVIEELRSKNDEAQKLLETVNQQSETIWECEAKIKEQAALINQYKSVEREKETLVETLDQNKTVLEEQTEAIRRFVSNERQFEEKIAALEQTIAGLQLSQTEKISALELEMYDLRNKLRLSETDLKDQRARFDEYKSKVASVLKENKLNHGDYSRNVESLNLKIESLQEENERLRRDLERLTNEAQCLQEEKDKMKTVIETLKGQIKDHEVLKKSFDLLTADNDKLNTIIKQLQISFAKEKIQIAEENKEQCDNLKLNYETKIKNLEEEMTRLRASDDSHSVVNSNNSNTSFEEIKDENCSIQSNGSSSLEKNFLEEILSCNEEPGSKSVPHNGLNVDNLTQLLAESENNISLLTEQNRVLKEEIRRLNRSIDRMDIANNLEYLKNVLLKFLTSRQDEKDQLIEVLSTILKLTPEERTQFQEHVPDQYSNHTAAAGWNLWQWSS